MLGLSNIHPEVGYSGVMEETSKRKKICPLQPKGWPWLSDQTLVV